MNRTEVSTRPTLEQRRARHAWQKVTAFRGAQAQGKEYAREAKKLPIRIVNSGLGQSLAFLLAKEKDKGQLHRDLTEWVVQERFPQAAAEPESLLNSVIQGDAVFLRRATDEVMAYLQWLNRFAEAEGLLDGEQ